MTIEIPSELDISVKERAQALGLQPDLYVREILERDLAAAVGGNVQVPFESGYGMWNKYGVSISEEEIDENRVDIFRTFGADCP